MSVLIRVGATKAIFREGEWVSCERLLEARLNEVTSTWIEETGGPSLRDGDPERACAQAVASLVGGVVVKHLPSRGKSMHEMFLGRRQMTLDF